MNDVTQTTIAEALDFIGTPLALEVLGDLATGCAPDSRGEDGRTLETAVARLAASGAVARSGRSARIEAGSVEITPQGKELYWHLVEIEHMAELLMNGTPQTD